MLRKRRLAIWRGKAEADGGRYIWPRGKVSAPEEGRQDSGHCCGRLPALLVSVLHPATYRYVETRAACDSTVTTLQFAWFPHDRATVEAVREQFYDRNYLDLNLTMNWGNYVIITL